MADAGQFKLGRAREHSIEARQIAREWLDSDAFTVERTTDAATGRTEARVRIQGSPPDRLALAVGDAIHNLRAGLEHAVFGAAYVEWVAWRVNSAAQAQSAAATG